MRVTLKTVAREADVALGTASRILNGMDKGYAQTTCERVRSAAQRLRYRPNELIRGLQTGRTNTAGVIVPNTHFYAQIICGIHDVFAANQTVMLHAWSPRIGTVGTDTAERALIHQFVDRRVDGVILRPGCESFERSYFEEIWQRDIPLILVDRRMSSFPTDFVGTDDIAAGELATRYLVELGHRRLLFVGAGHEVSTSRLRAEGFKNIVSVSAGLSGRTVDFHDGDRTTLMAIMKDAERPTGIVCYQDAIAETVCGLLRALDLQVPRDVSVIGMGNLPPGNRTLPCLTTLDQKPNEIGRRAAQLYLERVGGEKTDLWHRRTILVEAALIPGGTTAPAAEG